MAAVHSREIPQVRGARHTGAPLLFPIFLHFIKNGAFMMARMQRVMPMRNHIRLRSIVVVVVVYGYLLIQLAILGTGVLVVGLVYGVACAFAAYSLYQREARHLANGAATFRKNFPMSRYGVQLAQFQHVFHAAADLLDELRARIAAAVAERTELPTLAEMRFIDVDPLLAHPEERAFWSASGKAGARESRMTLVLHLNHAGRMQGIHWWILAAGYTSRDKLCTFIAFAPFTLPFWLWPYLHHNYDLLSWVRTLHGGFYDNLDLLTETKAVHETVYNTLVEVLEAHGVDVSDLKTQRAQVLNIAISGGQTRIGQIIQGAFGRPAEPQRKAA